ncbi:DNA polymerase III subunit delta' [Liquorilactobacillus nagelii]|jgi:DNA polymerase-3 subunit delta'|uniref:DNA polymerase III subunit delta' n=2 Tax=Liquorilactobacillus nagelii TaxID=82688 RepID=UPI0006EFAC91|nr:DNA polymerase III subunit delta' [Liquorilactobacillus nagelii]KRL41971.1 DNA polymerase III subunit delta [Liquorilactobacillus nagelii DSM 13675]QYH54580.1 DNA polymerase III subunit delta' [Liquorilactobacillus nagelii DSM 13675]
MTEKMFETPKQQKFLANYFASLLKQNQLVHAYLLTGPAGSGKRSLALWVAAGLFCLHPETTGSPCGKCAECQRILTGNHPDVIDVVPDGSSVKVEQTRFLKAEFSKSGVEGRRKVIILESAEKLTISAANSLLKFIEEPSGQMTFFLLAQNVNQLLPTIVSRCQLLKMVIPSETQRSQLFAQAGISASKSDLLAGLTVDLQVAKQLDQTGAVYQLSDKLIEWYLKILSKDWLSVVDVQSQIMPIVVEKKDQQLLLELLELLVKDLINWMVNNQVKYFAKYQTQLTPKLKQLTVNQQLAAIELLLKQPKLRQANINFQNALEALTLQLLKCYDR